jgi:hypothetical protein
MPAGSVTMYDSAGRFLAAGANLLTATVKMALLTSAYTPNQVTHDRFSNVSGNQIAGGAGYTSGGATLGTKALTAVTKGFKFSSANVVWTASGANIPAWRFGVLYIEGTVDGITNPLLGYFLGDVAPADIPATLDGSTLTITTPAAGWFDITRP